MSPQKKEVLGKILTALIPYREVAEGFLLLLKEDGNNELKENLYQEILKNLKNIKSKNQQEQVKTALKKLKEKSERTIKTDYDEAEKILNDFINNIE